MDLSSQDLSSLKGEIFLAQFDTPNILMASQHQNIPSQHELSFKTRILSLFFLKEILFQLIEIPSKSWGFGKN